MKRFSDRVQKGWHKFLHLFAKTDEFTTRAFDLELPAVIGWGLGKLLGLDIDPRQLQDKNRRHRR